MRPEPKGLGEVFPQLYRGDSERSERHQGRSPYGERSDALARSPSPNPWAPRMSGEAFPSPGAASIP